MPLALDDSLIWEAPMKNNPFEFYFSVYMLTKHVSTTFGVLPKSSKTQ